MSSNAKLDVCVLFGRNLRSILDEKGETVNRLAAILLHDAPQICRTFISADSLTLSFDNPTYPPIIVPQISDVSVIGRPIFIQRILPQA